MVYPQWTYFPRNAKPAPWVRSVVDVVAAAEPQICTVHESTGLKSDDVLAVLRPGLEKLKFKVETGKKREQKIARPVLYGDNGVPAVSYEIDGFQDEWGAALEVEAGQGRANNNDYRDIVRTSLILDARYLILLMPITYRAGGKTSPQIYKTQAYNETRGQLDAIYASTRLKLPFEGLLLVGY
jgi:hypothetical protein